jgi:NAD(P)-dependent dehydrogenase (short-subunit alcohol dehydrogenase family)
MLLKDKVIMISGIGPGLGVKLALEAARAGARGVAIAARSADKLDDAEARIRADGNDCQVLKVPTDIRDRAACERFAAATVDRFGRIDTLFNSAYLHGAFEPVADGDLNQWHPVFETNVFGTMTLTQAVIPQLKAQQSGAIVTITTLGMQKPYVGGAGYAASKGALAVLSRYLAQELAPYGIRANSVACGWMWGEPVQQYVRKAAADYDISEQEVLAQYTSAIPGGRMPTDEDCARAALFLASDYARAVNGALLDANGGEYMR